jgi:hypothetical protein
MTDEFRHYRRRTWLVDRRVFLFRPLIEANYASTGGTFHISDASLRFAGNTALLRKTLLRA